jgi:ATP-dependent RNA helicase DDX23/PRP28
MQAIPIGLQGRDILGVAETGSGKTAAFVLPMLVYISKLPKMTREMEADGPYALVLAPSRELAGQIENETKKFAKYSSYRTVLVVGGQPIEEQAMKLRKGCEIIIATPGRLNDCLVSRYVVLNQCNYIVLDEADRMIDMGFETQVIQILESMPRETLKSEVEEVAELQEKDHRNKFRTTLMFSATMPPEVERLSRNYLRRPGVIYIGVVGRAVDRIKQNVVFVKSDHEKKTRLEQLLREGPPPPIIIFVNQRKTCDNIAKYINKLAYRVTTLQGGRSQDQRDWSLSEFREGRYDILVATDIAGRGLDVKGVTHVINYDLPKNIEQYTHRIGRTGRAGESGLATSFFTNEDAEILYDLKKMLQDTENPVPHELASHPEAQMKPGGFVAQSRRDTVIYVS